MIKNKVSILMSAYNSECYIESAISSVLNQKYTNYEFIIIDDASTDSTANIINRFAKIEPRIVLIKNGSNQGLTRSLNIGLKHVTGEYILRMDADDYMKGDRISKQVNFLSKKKEYILVGSNAIYLDENNLILSRSFLPISDLEIRVQCLFNNPFLHSSVLFRSSLIKEHKLKYSNSFKTTQDWKLWIKFLKFGKVGNIKKPLVYIRRHSRQISYTNKSLQLKNSLRIQKIYLEDLLDIKFWNRDIFLSINTILLSDRHNKSSTQIAKVCNFSLDLCDLIYKRYANRSKYKIYKLIVKRCILIGLFSLKIKSIYLFLRLLRKHSVTLLISFIEIIYQKLVNKAYKYKEF